MTLPPDCSQLTGCLNSMNIKIHLLINYNLFHMILGQSKFD